MRRFLSLPLAVLALATLPVDAAPPALGPGATLRLIPAGVRDGVADVGLEIALEPGWKTYWRTPGDAGIPPSLDSTGSTSVTRVDVHYPLPVRFDEAGLTGIGYIESVILPLDVRLADPSRPADLTVAVDIGLCRDICVPLGVKLALHIDPAALPAPADVARLAGARAAVPVAATGETLPRIVALGRDGASPPGITVEVVEPAGLAATEVDLLVEGPTADWALPLPEAVASTSGRRTWRFTLDGAPKGADLAASPLRFALRAGAKGFEQTVGLDGRGLLP